MKINVGSWVTRQAARNPGKVALICEESRLTYADLDERSDRLANGLKSKEVSRGDRVALLLLNGAELVESVIACAKMGAIAVPLNWRLSPVELAGIVSDCAPAALIYDQAMTEAGAHLSHVESLIAGSLVVDTGSSESSYETALAEAPKDNALDSDAGDDDPHLILYTSGTTGRPKGVVLSHNNTFWQSLNGWALGASPDTVGLVLLPMFHAGGINGSVTPMLHIGATLVVPRTFDTAATLATLARERVTGMVAVPTIYQMLADHPDFDSTDLSAVEAFISGGAPLPRALVERYHRRNIELRQGYGLTETSPGATGMGPGEHLRKAGTVGKPCLYTEIRILSDGGEPVGEGEVGEVCVKGPNIMVGYWNRPEETAHALRGGWFHSGDLGSLDSDGFLTIVGRIKDMIISGGENIYPAEVEALLRDHGAVDEAAVVGIADPKWGEVPIAFVTVVPGQHVSPDELTAYCAAKIAKYKVPKRVYLRGEMPRNALGKIVKPTLIRDVI